MCLNSETLAVSITNAVTINVAAIGVLIAAIKRFFDKIIPLENTIVDLNVKMIGLHEA